MRFTSFLSGGFTTMVVINPPEKKLAKHTSDNHYHPRFKNLTTVEGLTVNKTNIVTKSPV